MKLLHFALKQNTARFVEKKFLAKKQKKEKGKKRYLKKSKIPFRLLTDISEFLFCKYDFLGESIKQIAKDYDRNPSQVRQVIQTAKANGNYQKHIDKYKAMVGR